MEKIKDSWIKLQKISFRFSFLFLSLTSFLVWDIIIYFVSATSDAKRYDLTWLFKPLSEFFYWLDKHLYHTGYDPAIHSSYAGSTHYGIVFYLTLIFLAFVVSVIWSFLDKRRKSYDRLFYWFTVYLRYTLAIVIISYGIEKIIPSQMPFPAILQLTKYVGDQSKMEVLWNFMGASPGYQIFTGLCEFTAGLLLLFRRTALIGAILAITVLVNILALDIFYNVPAKFFTIQLLFYALFIAARYLKNLFIFLLRGSPEPTSQKRFVFTTKWKYYLLTTTLIVVPLVFILLNIFGDIKNFEDVNADSRKEKVYDVINFIARDTLPPHTTDTLRWKRITFSVVYYGNICVIYGMNDQQSWYQFEIDSVQKTFALYNNPDKNTWTIFHYDYLQKNQLQLSGKWNGQEIQVLLKEFPPDSMNLKKEKIKLVVDN